MRHGIEAVRRYFGIAKFNSLPEHKELNRRYITDTVYEIKAIGDQEINIEEDQYPDTQNAENELDWLVSEIDEMQEYVDELSDIAENAICVIEECQQLLMERLTPDELTEIKRLAVQISLERAK